MSPNRGRGLSAAARLLAIVGLTSMGGALAAVPADPEVEFPEGWRWSADAQPVEARRGMVVTTDSLASAAGLAILRQGGNAVDAAVAVQFALAVVHPQAGNIGGGGFMVLRLADDTRAALDFREEAPSGATPDMFLDERREVTRGATWHPEFPAPRPACRPRTSASAASPGPNSWSPRSGWPTASR